MANEYGSLISYKEKRADSWQEFSQSDLIQGLAHKQIAKPESIESFQRGTGKQLIQNMMSQAQASWAYPTKSSIGFYENMVYKQSQIARIMRHPELPIISLDYLMLRI